MSHITMLPHQISNIFKDLRLKFEWQPFCLFEFRIIVTSGRNWPRCHNKSANTCLAVDQLLNFPYSGNLPLIIGTDPHTTVYLSKYVIHFISPSEGLELYILIFLFEETPEQRSWGSETATVYLTYASRCIAHRFVLAGRNSARTTVPVFIGNLNCGYRVFK